MNYIYTWLGLLVGVVMYRALGPTNIPLVEHIAGLYFAAVALLTHFILEQQTS